MTDKTVSERIKRIVNELAKPNDKELLALELNALVTHAILEFLKEKQNEINK